MEFLNKNVQSNKAFQKKKKKKETLLSKEVRAVTVRHNLTCYNLLYGYPLPGSNREYPYGIPYRVCPYGIPYQVYPYSTGDLGIQMIVKTPSPIF